MQLRRASRQRWFGPLATWVTLAGVVAAVPSGAAAASAPIVTASVATKDGTLIGPLSVRARQTTVKVGGRRCTVAAGTPLAALIALRAKAKAPRVSSLGLKDYGGCGKRPSSSARLYLTAIGSDRAYGPDGWVYAVGDRSGATGAADPAGPFAKGRLRTGADVAWRWCRASEDPEGDCGDVYAIANPGVQDSFPATFGARILVRSGGGDGAASTSAPAPDGTVVRLLSPAGAELARGAVSGGSVSIVLPSVVPAGSRIVVAGAARIAPTGILWPRPTP